MDKEVKGARFLERVKSLGELEVTVLASSKFPSRDDHLDVDELRGVAFNLDVSQRAFEHVKRCGECERRVHAERADNPIIEDDDGDPA